MNKLAIEVVLVITCPALSGPAGTKFLLTKRDGQRALPWTELGEQESTLEAAARLLVYQTGIRARMMGQGWLDLTPCPLADHASRIIGDKRVIAAPFGCMLPEQVITTKDPDSLWFSFPEILEFRPLFLDNLDILTAVSNRI